MMYTQHVTRLRTPPLHRLIIDCLDTHRHTQSSPVWLFPEKDLGFQEVKSKPLRGAASSQRQARKLTLVCQTGYLNLAPASATAKWDGAFHRDAKAPFQTTFFPLLRVPVSHQCLMGNHEDLGAGRASAEELGTPSNFFFT